MPVTLLCPCPRPCVRVCVQVALCFIVMQILANRGHTVVSGILGSLYIISHYLMAVIMYMEMDRPIDDPNYSALDAINFLRRQASRWQHAMRSYQG